MIKMTTETLQVSVDTMLAEATHAQAKAASQLTYRLSVVHALVGDEDTYRYEGRRRVRQPYRLTDAEALAQLRSTGAVKSYDQYQVPALLEQVAATEAALADAQERIAEGNAIFRKFGGWSRFFLVTGGHIHSSMHCSTCNNGQSMTDFGWLPQLSGLTEAEAVAAHGAILCTVCFPSAPVEWTNQYELDAAAKQAAQCPGSGTYYRADLPKRTGYYSGNWATCPDCNGHITLTSTGKLRAHKAG